MDLFMMRNVLEIAKAFIMYAKRSSVLSSEKHRLTDMEEIPAHGARPYIYGTVQKVVLIYERFNTSGKNGIYQQYS